MVMAALSANSVKAQSCSTEEELWRPKNNSPNIAAGTATEACVAKWGETRGQPPNDDPVISFCDYEGSCEGVTSTGCGVDANGTYYSGGMGFGNDNGVQTISNPCDPTNQCWNSLTQSCEFECLPPLERNPVTDECESPLCPAGTTLQAVPNFSGQPPLHRCLPPFEPDCDGNEVVGHVGDLKLCRDEADDCIYVEGSNGFDSNGGYNCWPRDQFPENEDDAPPDCGPGQVSVYDLDTGESLCENLDDDPPENPDTEDPNDPDLDGDGTPDKNDDDIDGDGTPNSQDDDIDGDGVPNADDPDPYGQEEGGDESSVTGGGNCGKQPACKGDAVQCAILLQTWKTACNVKENAGKVEGGGSCSDPFRCNGDAVTCALLEYQWNQNCETRSLTEGDVSGSGYVTDNPLSRLDDGDTNLVDELDDVFNQSGGGSSCPGDASLNFTFGSDSFSYQPFCDLAEMVNPLVRLSFGIVGFLIVLRAFQ